MRTLLMLAAVIVIVLTFTPVGLPSTVTGTTSDPAGDDARGNALGGVHGDIDRMLGEGNDYAQDAIGSLRGDGPATPGSTEDLLDGLSAILDGAREGMSDATGQVFDLGRALAGNPPAAETEAPWACSATGTAVRGDVEAALAAVTRLDDGTHVGAARWQQDVVGVTVTGDAGDDASLARVDQMLSWISRHTGVDFVRGAGDDITVDLSVGFRPRAVLQVQGDRILSVDAQWDPTHSHACRWTAEELIHAAGPGGDHGPVGSVLSKDQTALGPSDFDAWVLAGLYGADVLTDDGVRAALAALR